MISNYIYVSICLLFVSLSLIFNYYYRSSIEKFFLKKSNFNLIENNSPLYSIWPYEFKINSFMIKLYVLDIILIFSGLVILGSKSNNDNLTNQIGFYFLVISTFITLIFTINYFRIIKKEKKAISTYSVSNIYENKAFIPIPQNIVNYRKIAYICLLISQIFLLLSIYGGIDL